MGPEGIILVNPPITAFQQSLTHSAVAGVPNDFQQCVKIGYIGTDQKNPHYIFTKKLQAGLCVQFDQ